MTVTLPDPAPLAVTLRLHCTPLGQPAWWWDIDALVRGWTILITDPRHHLASVMLAARPTVIAVGPGWPGQVADVGLHLGGGGPRGRDLYPGLEPLVTRGDGLPRQSGRRIAYIVDLTATLDSAAARAVEADQ